MDEEYCTVACLKAVKCGEIDVVENTCSQHPYNQKNAEHPTLRDLKRKWNLEEVAAIHEPQRRHGTATLVIMKRMTTLEALLAQIHGIVHKKAEDGDRNAFVAEAASMWYSANPWQRNVKYS